MGRAKNIICDNLILRSGDGIGQPSACAAQLLWSAASVSDRWLRLANVSRRDLPQSEESQDDGGNRDDGDDKKQLGHGRLRARRYLRFERCVEEGEAMHSLREVCGNFEVSKVTYRAIDPSPACRREPRKRNAPRSISWGRKELASYVRLMRTACTEQEIHGS